MDPIIISYYSTIQRKITKTWIVTNEKGSREELAKIYGRYVKASKEEIEAMFSTSYSRGGSYEDLFGELDLSESGELKNEKKETKAEQRITMDGMTLGPGFKSRGPEVEVSNEISFFEFDRLYDVALKISTLSGIPYYRLHLDYINKDGNRESLYKLFAGGPYDTGIMTYGHDMLEFSPEVYVDKYTYDIRADTKIYVTDTFSVISGVKFIMISDLNELMTRVKFSDDYSRELIFYGLVLKYWPQLSWEPFKEYIKDENKIMSKYPELSRPMEYIKSQYNIERRLLKGVGRKEIKDVMTSINKCVVSGLGPGPLNLRNIFDTLGTNDPGNKIHMPEIHYFVKDGNSLLQFSKVQHGVKMRGIPNQQILKAGLTVLIMRGNDPMYFSLHSNGRWYFKATFAEEDFMNFDGISSFVKRYASILVGKINKIGLKGSPMGPIILDGMTYDNISASLFWKKILTENQFRELIRIMDSYVAAGILSQHDIVNTVKDSQLYIFKKGTYEFDNTLIDRVMIKSGRGEIKNQFEYLVNPLIRSKWNELYSGRMIRVLHRASDVSIEIQDAQKNEFDLFMDIILYILRTSGIKESDLTSIKNNLDKSKEQDPVLFNLKKAGYPVVYARICQKKMQPIGYQESEYGSLPDNIKKKLVKYKNFTYDRPAYYMCPGNTYKYLNFISGVHPAGYCLPCCFKTPVSDRERKAKQIFESCTQRFKGPDEILSDSKHILATNKVLDIGRIGHIPEIFKKIMPRDTYMYGLSQYSRAIFCPMLSIGGLIMQELRGKFIPKSTDPVNYFIDELYSRLVSKGKTFMPDLDPNDLLLTFGRSDSLQNNSVDWNGIITRALLIFWGITIVFCENEDIDIPSQGSMTDKIVFVIKRVYSKESSVNQSGPAWYPVCQVDRDYFKTSKIGSCIFSLKEDLDILDVSLDQYNISQESNVNKRPGADNIIQFLGLGAKDYTKYVGKNNKVYAIFVDTLGLMIPVDYSDYASGKERISFDPVKSNNDPDTLKKFFDSFEMKGYIPFEVTQVLKRNKDGMYTGVIVNGIQCPHNPINKSPFMKEGWNEESRVLSIDYDIDDVNRLLLVGQNGIRDEDTSRGLYKYYIYDLIVMQVTSRLKSFRDPDVQKRIRNEFESSGSIPQVLKSLGDIMPRGSPDFEKMMAIIKDEKDKKKVLDEVLRERYSWDQTYSESFYTSEKIREIIEETCIRKKIDIKSFPNVYEPCPGPNEYCLGDRLIVDCEDDFWDSLPNLILDDFTNEIKKTYLMDRLFYDNIIDQFSYNVSQNESLFIKKK